MSGIVFGGIDGSNPLGFLAGLGAHRLLSLIWPERAVEMRWIARGGWRPEVLGLGIGEEEICGALLEKAPWAPLELFAPLGKNLTVGRALYQEVVEAVERQAVKGSREGCDFAAALGSDVFEDKERIEYTDFCFITGSGHQHFLGTASGLAQSVRIEHLRETLFEEWRHGDKGYSFRWDPDDAREYALRWGNPSTEGAMTVWGANRLAFEALPLFPTVPTGGEQRTVGFRKEMRLHEFTWPIWTQPASVDVVRSLLGMADLQEETPDRVSLQARGIAEIFRAQRVRIGMGANFKVSFRPARAV